MAGKRVRSNDHCNNWKHTFETHGHGSKNTRKLRGRAGSENRQQGQWLNNEIAAEWIFDNRNFINGPFTDLPLPKGLGQVILPDGTVTPATHARIVPLPDGTVRTAFPIVLE